VNTGRDLRVGIRVSGAELDTLRRRATAHGLAVATFVRRAALDSAHEPDARSADTWWAGLGGERRIQVHRWLTEDRAGGPFPGQIAFDADPVGGTR
jgi:hypothetical protein